VEAMNWPNGVDATRSRCDIATSLRFVLNRVPGRLGLVPPPVRLRAFTDADIQVAPALKMKQGHTACPEGGPDDAL
jgi:hypothetical protein